VEPVARESIAERIEQVEALDAVSESLQRAVRALVPEESGLKDILSGTWLGHPLHPPLTDIVVGAWTSALLLDLLGDDQTDGAADVLVGIGILAAVPTAAAGLSDWAELRGGNRRVGAVHALGNTTALLLHMLSLLARSGGDRTRGRVLSAAGVAAASFSAWLGGHLSFGRGVGVNQTAFEALPAEWTQAARFEELADGALTGAEVDGTAVVLARSGDAAYALVDRCSHRGCSLHEGKLENETIICPCHGSTFRLDGSIVKGPATAPQPALEVRISDGTVEVRRRG
jgi:nitrite reductase/ring-hydroxylating ferredoxin subunit/uncharacterized membrane protein